MEEPGKRALDTYGPEEMAIPEYRVVQKVGADWARAQGAEEGQFYNTLTGDVADELSIIVVDILCGRSRWGAEITGFGPICFSLNAKSNKSAEGEDCNNCEYRLDTPWSMDASERRKMCCLNYTILGIDLDHDNTPILIRSHGVSALPTRQLISQLRMNRSLKGEYHRAVINIKSQKKDTPYGSTYIMRHKLIRLVEDEVVAEELRIESQRLLGAPIPLPEGRPEEEGGPLGFTPQGTPFYSEEERDKLIAQEAPAVESETVPEPEPTPKAVESETVPEPEPTPKAEPKPAAEAEPLKEKPSAKKVEEEPDLSF